MIWYLNAVGRSYVIQGYLRMCGEPRSSRFRVKTYPSLFRHLHKFGAEPGTYIFTDIEYMGMNVAQAAAQAWNTISDLGDKVRILNHPSRLMQRYELLRTLYEQGYNTFNTYRLVECRQPQRWPVFIRPVRSQKKYISLLYSHEQLEAATAYILAHGGTREDKLIVEFCDTRDDQGLFYGYSAFLIGERVIPRHMFASRHWLVQGQEHVTTPEVLEKERCYMETNPHERELREIFRLARIDYGRIDYAILGDRLQVWEINLNANVYLDVDRNAFHRSAPLDAERKAMLNQFGDRIAAAFAEIDIEDAAHEPVSSVSFR